MGASERELITPTRGRYFCPVALPWFRFRRDDTPAARMRLAAYQYFERRSRWSALTRLRYLTQWPFFSARIAWRAQRRWGAELEAHAGIGRWQQLRETLALTFGDNVPAHTYYIFRLWQPERRRDATLYLHEFESQPLQRGINSHADMGLVDDKLRFHATCLERGLPAVRNIATFFTEGRELWTGPRDALPLRDLFLKRNDGICGKGAECWVYSPSDASWSHGGASLRGAELIEHCRERARSHSRILQVRLRNHPDVAPLSRAALCTLRMVTYKLPGERSRYFRTCLRMPHGDEVVDNFTPGGVAAAVLPSGELGRGARPFVSEPVDVHPDTGGRITGRVIPHWEDAQQIVLTAHDAFDLDGMIGWDVAITPDGPLLLEGNSVWGVELMQASHHEPLGRTEFPAIVEAFQRARGIAH